MDMAGGPRLYNSRRAKRAVRTGPDWDIDWRSVGFSRPAVGVRPWPGGYAFIYREASMATGWVGAASRRELFVQIAIKPKAMKRAVRHSGALRRALDRPVEWLSGRGAASLSRAFPRRFDRARVRGRRRCS